MLDALWHTCTDDINVTANADVSHFQFPVTRKNRVLTYNLILLFIFDFHRWLLFIKKFSRPVVNIPISFPTILKILRFVKNSKLSFF
jgi:hypothetical protein